MKYDIAIIACAEEEIIGGIWGRILSSQDPGYGFINEQTPEISLTVFHEYRNKGIGAQLLQRIESTYRELLVPSISLSVDKRNPATRLYKRLGYKHYCDVDTSQTMIRNI